jgi:CubicO group peptidase (beta-lactamase class C family)
MIGRRQFIAGSTAAALSAAVRPLCAAPFEWRQAAPGETGFAPDFAARLDQFVQSGRVSNIHGILIVRRGRIALERYFESEDETWGKTLGRVRFASDTLHDVRSISKSIVALVYGAALAEKKVPPPSELLLTQFPEYADVFDADERRKRLTIEHALTMALGIAWGEMIPWEDPANSERAMEEAKDRYRYILERPVVEEPGQRWVYSGGATALVARIVMRGTGRGLHEYARAALFDPAGLGPTEWINPRDLWGIGDGEPAAASGLRISPRDLARIGQMLLDGGKAGERQIVPAAWLEDSFKPAARINDRRHYGYHWYVGNVPFDSPEGRRRARWIGAVGNGGQRLVVFPDLELVVVITAGNYNLRGRAPDDIFNEVVLPSVR